MTYSQWKSQALGRHIDVDGAYGAQCVDVYLDYIQKVIGVSNWASVSGYGDAAALLPKANLNYFTRLGPAGLPQQGDVIFYGPTATNSAGHVAIVDSANNSGVQTIEQDGFNPGGSTYTKFRPWNGTCIGWLRPKVNINQDTGDIMNQGDVTNAYRILLKREPDAGGLATYTGKSWNYVFYAITNSQEYKNLTGALDQKLGAYDSLVAQVQELSKRPRPEELEALQAKVNEDQVKLSELQKAVEDEKNKPPVVVEKVVEVEPNWLGKVRDAVLTFLKLKKG